MIVGIPKEIKPKEYRVACHPAGVGMIVDSGHTVLIEKNAGVGSGFTDQEYIEAGAKVVDSGVEIYNQADIVYKVKEILPEEYNLIRQGQIILTYLHSNGDRDMTDAFIKTGAIGIAYEDVDDEYGEFPLLKPMSILAGKGGMLAALAYSQRINNGQGIILSNITGVNIPQITIIGAGNSGYAAAEMAAQLGNRVTILDINMKAMELARRQLPNSVEFLISNEENLKSSLEKTDVLINCILWPKDRKDHLVNREMLKLMKKGSLIVDVSADVGGAIETSRTTTHDDPIYVVDGITHYVVDNIPSAFSKTGSIMLANATLPYLLKILDNGLEKALIKDKHLRRGLSFYNKKLTLEETGLSQNRPYTTPEKVLGIGGI